MKKNIGIYLAALALAVLIVLPVNTSVKHLSSNRVVALSPATLSGNPLPMPTPPGFALASSGNPGPMPTPPGRALTASGNPLPMPTPPRFAVKTSGNPLPMPTPPGRIA
jgi:hypothetical protein